MCCVCLTVDSSLLVSLATNRQVRFSTFFRCWSLTCVGLAGGLWLVRVRGMCRVGVCAYTCAGWFWRDEFYPSINLSAVVVPLEFGQFLKRPFINFSAVVVPLEFGQFLKFQCWCDRAPSKKKVGRLAVFSAVSPYRSGQIRVLMSTGQQSGSRSGLREALFVVWSFSNAFCESHHECNDAVLQSCLGEPWEECCQLRDSGLSLLFVLLFCLKFFSVTRHLAGPTP